MNADFLPPETRRQIEKNRLYLDNVHRVREEDKNKFYNFVLKYGILPKITTTGVVIHEEK